MGFFIGAVGGAILGVWLGVSPFASRLLNPYLNALNALPKVALAPLFVLWFGLGLESKIALAAVLVLFLVFLNTFAGVREVDQDLIDGARLMRATRAQVIAKVIIPSAMSWVFAGLKISVPYALIGAVLGEMIAANRGLGYLVQFSGAQFDSAGVFAVLFVIALLAVALNFLVEMVQHRHGTLADRQPLKQELSEEHAMRISARRRGRRRHRSRRVAWPGGCRRAGEDHQYRPRLLFGRALYRQAGEDLREARADAGHLLSSRAARWRCRRR